MKSLEQVVNGVYFVGVHDRDAKIFERQFSLPCGMSYNSYAVIGEKIAVMDSVEKDGKDEWLANIRAALGGRKPDYLVVQHMEPDHSANIIPFLEEYPEARIVGNAKTLAMIKQFFGFDPGDRAVAVADGDTLSLGERELKFLFAPMVHWPEVMVTYDGSTGTLFSADAFGRFGTGDAETGWIDEARRYYFGIVGKYGMQVNALLRKASALDIKRILPLHGPALTGDIAKYIDIYTGWANYVPEEKRVLIAWTSVYGNTAKAVRLLDEKLQARGIKTAVRELLPGDLSPAVADAFRCDRIVLASTTYNMGVFPPMREFIEHLTERGFRNRRVGIIENGSWAPAAAKTMKALLEGAKDIAFCENTVTIRSALDEAAVEKLGLLADELAD